MKSFHAYSRQVLDVNQAKTTKTSDGRTVTLPATDGIEYSSMMHPHQTSSSTRPAAAASSDIVVAYKELKKFLLLSKDEA